MCFSLDSHFFQEIPERAPTKEARRVSEFDVTSLATEVTASTPLFTDWLHNSQSTRDWLDLRTDGLLISAVDSILLQ